MRRALLPIGLVLLSSCGNRAIDVKIEALGPELQGVEEGEYHRPGQPCLLCHDEYGGKEPRMVVGGTIFGTPAVSQTYVPGQPDDTMPIPAEGALVTITDSLGKVITKETNCIGNFWVEAKDALAFPLHAEIECKPGGGTGCSTTDFSDGCDRQVMTTRISRDGSCGGCHVGNRDQGSPGWVYCSQSQTDPPFVRPGSACQGVP